MHKKQIISQPWTKSVKECSEMLGVERLKGLDSHQVHRMRKLYGSNNFRQAEKKSIIEILLAQFKNIIVILLAVAGILSFVFHEYMDGFAIIGVIVINAAIGFFMELKAVRSMEALHKLEKVTAKVRREEKMQEISAKDLVVGDIVLIEGGDIVSADMRLLTVAKLQADESILTGESLPVTKKTDITESDASIGDRINMLFKGTSVTRGSGEAIVTAVGMETELGKIADLVQKAEDVTTPLEKRLDALGRNLLWVTLGLIAIITLTGIFISNESPKDMIEMAIALAVAAIPEGLPIVATLALARGMLRMAKQNALVNNLAAVETLGGTSVICTDKTGTLTENKMTVTELIFSDSRIKLSPLDESGRGEFTIEGNPVNVHENTRLKNLLEVGVLCNNASLNNTGSRNITGIGDPLEVAFLILANKAGINYEQVNRQYPEKAEDAFDSETKKMATFNKTEKGYWIAAKGAMETILADSATVMTANGSEELTEKSRQYWIDQNLALAEKGYRVLALAMKHEDTLDADPYENLEFIGLACMEDPAREDVKDAIEACRTAGIRTVMITGDHPKTAASIAASVHLTEKPEEAIIGKDIMHADEMTEQDEQRYRNASVFARVSPKQKLDLITVHQDAGSVVAMTGDGVNDAPALKKADIGIAMGLRGTQVAQEAADMVLKDDSFSTIVIAVEQGRIIFDNIRKFVVYLLSCNISEIMVVFAASLVNAPLPILPLQILFLNLVTDVFPALALGVGRGSSQIMKQKPRSSDEPILPKEGWYKILGFGAVMSVAVLIAFTLAFKMLNLDKQGAVTISFLTLAFSQLWHIFNMRAAKTHWANNEVVNNRYVWGALALCTVLLIVSVYTPFIAEILELSNPGLKGWLLIIIASSITCIAGQLWRYLVDKQTH